MDTARREQHDGAQPDGPVRSSIRKALIYFGLATDGSEPPTQTPPRRRLIEMLALTFIVAGAVGGHRGNAAGWLAAALFAPLLLACVAEWLRRDREPREPSDVVALPPIMIGVAMWLFSRHAALWQPLAFGAVLSAVLLVAGWANSTDRRGRTSLR